MDAKDRQKIYSLLSRYYPNARQLKDPKTLTAWGFALERFTYEDVKSAVINYAISNKFFPDLSDITAGLAREEGTTACSTATPTDVVRKQCAVARLFRTRKTAAIRAAGLPDFDPQAETFPEWWNRTCAAGVDLTAIFDAAFCDVFRAWPCEVTE